MNRWRRMTAEDIAAAKAIADRVHGDHPEDEAVFADRLQLHPDGCRILEADGGIVAYILSHPWRAHTPPALNTVLGCLPDAPDTYYIHDIALLPQVRGTGAAASVVEAVAEDARTLGLATMSLVAVNGSAGFWRSRGFRQIDDPELAETLAGYGGGAVFMVRDVR